MELCQLSLSDYIKYTKQDLDIHKIKSIMYQILHAFKYIHSKKIIHRDIKPPNIGICDGVVKILDFGSCALMRSEINSGGAYCTLYNRPPEELAPTYKNIPQFDIWSIGILFYYIVVGKYPIIAANETELLNNILQMKGSPTAQDRIKIFGSL